MPNYTLGSTRVVLMQPDLTTFQTNGTVVLDSRRTRPLWFDGRFLAAADLEREQNYFLQREADLGQAPGFEVLNGLLVDQVATNGKATPDTIVIHAGEGVTPAGEMLSVPSDLTVRLSDLTVQASLDAQLGLATPPPQPAQQRTGLFVIALQPVEFAANPITAYPTTVQGPRTTHLGDIVEATAVSLVPYPNPPTQFAASLQQAALARQIFLTGAGTLPDSLLPLAVVSLQQGVISWIDPYLVRRDTGPQFSGVSFGLTDPATQQAFLMQYDTHLQAAVAARQASGLKANIAATDYFQALPPAGRFPIDAIDTGAFSQVFFPQQMDVRLSIIPSDELPALLSDGMSLPPIDLTLPDSAYANLAVFALIPVPVANFASLKSSLPAVPLNPILPQVLANRSPLQLLQLYQGTVTIAPVPPISNSAWATAIGSQQYAYYIRRPSDPTFVPFESPSGVTLVSSENPSIFGQPVTFTAMIAPGNAVGSVQFLDGGTSLGTVTVSGGTAALPNSSLVVGAHPITAVYSGDTTNAGSASAVLTQNVTLSPSSVTVTSSSNPSIAGQPVTFTANVSPASATGSVEFLDGATSLGTAALAGGVAALPPNSSLALGAHSITAVYSGDANTSGSTSPALTQTVNKIASSVTLSSSSNPVTFGQPVAFTANVSPNSATGSVQFLDGTTSLATVTLAGGAAALPATSSLAVGSHSIRATYSGDANDSGSSAVIVQTVSKIVSSATLTSSANPSAFGQTVTFTAKVAPATATGSVQFLDGATALGTATLSGGAAILAVSSLAVGAHSVTAVYAGDGNDASSTSAVLTQTVNKAASSATLSSSANPSTFGQTVTFTAKVSPASATGSVQFLDGATVLGTGTLSGGTATLAVPSLAVGAHSVTAAYTGDANDAPSTSAALTQTVSPVTSSVALSSSANPSALGQAVTLTAHVAPTSATGTVQFLDGTAALGTGTLSAGAATLAVSTLAVGAHSLTAVYSGDANNTASTSAVLTQTVNKTVPAVALSSSANPSTFGQAITLTAKVTPSTATGNMQFFDGSTSLGSATATPSLPGVWNLVGLSLAVGAHSLTASYSGDANDAAATSPALTQMVTPAASTVTVTTSNSQSIFGQSVTFTATVAPSSATGSVQFRDGTTALGTGTVSGGAASLAVSSLAVGTHSITAVYGGDANDAGSTSAVLSQFIVKAPGSVTVASSLNPSTVGQAVTFTATVSPASATGSVQFLDGSAALGTVALSGTTASLPVSTLAAAAHSITAVYSGDANFTGSTSAVLTETVNKVTASATLTSSVNPSAVGQAVTFTAKVSPASATGSVQFLNGTASLGSVALSGGAATLAVSTLAAGANAITAQYGGDGNTTTASAALTQTVSKTATSVTVTSSLNPAVVGQQVVLTAKVTPSTATGSIQFEDGGKPLGGALQLSGGVATLTVGGVTSVAVTISLAAGANPITAVYSGDANNAPSTSPVFTQTVNPAGAVIG